MAVYSAHWRSHSNPTRGCPRPGVRVRQCLRGFRHPGIRVPRHSRGFGFDISEFESHDICEVPDDICDGFDIPESSPTIFAKCSRSRNSSPTIFARCSRSSSPAIFAMVSASRNSSPAIFARFSRIFARFSRSSSPTMFAMVSTSRNSGPCVVFDGCPRSADLIQHYFYTTEMDLERGCLESPRRFIQYYFRVIEEDFENPKAYADPI